MIPEVDEPPTEEQRPETCEENLEDDEPLNEFGPCPRYNVVREYPMPISKRRLKKKVAWLARYAQHSQPPETPPVLERWTEED